MAALVFQPQGKCIHRWEENVSSDIAATLNHFITELVQQLAVLQPEGTTDLMKETWLLYQKVFTKTLTCKCTYLSPFRKGMDKKELQMHLEACVLWIPNYSRVCRDCQCAAIGEMASGI